MWHIFQLPGIHSSGQDFSTLTYKTSQWSFSSPCSPLSLFASFHLDPQLHNMGEVKRTTFTWTISRAAFVVVQQEWPEALGHLGLIGQKSWGAGQNYTIWHNQLIIISTTRRRLYWYGRCLWFSWGSGLLGNQVIRVFSVFFFFPSLYFMFKHFCLLFSHLFTFWLIVQVWGWLFHKS